MKFATTFLFLFFNLALFAQNKTDSVVFDGRFVLTDGIYTSYEELINNAPRFVGAELEFEKNSKSIDWNNVYYFTKSKTRLKYEYALFATVVNGHLAIYYSSQMNSVFVRGALCTFIVQELVTHTYNSPSNPSGMGGGVPVTTTTVEVNIYFLDLKTGIIAKVEKENLDPIIQRDSTLYSTFKKIKSDSNHKKSYPYVSQYNDRNKFYIKVIAISEEEE
jgi:hypothetical protein